MQDHQKHGCKLIIDAQGELLQEALRCEPDFVKPNIFELAEAVGDKPSADPEVVVHSARKMLDMGAKAVCVSMGQEGALLTAKDEPESLYVTTTPKIYDEGAVGTGDAMVGAIANAMHAGMKFDEVARYAVAMGRACARLAGTEMASQEGLRGVRDHAGLRLVSNTQTIERTTDCCSLFTLFAITLRS